MSEEITEWADAQLEEMLNFWADIFEEVKVRQAEYDGWVIQLYVRRKGLDNIDVYFCFAPGDQVLWKDCNAGKLVPHCLGPYTFIWYIGR